MIINFLLFSLASLCQNEKMYLFSGAKTGIHGSVAERSKALVKGTSLFGGLGSNPIAAICFFFTQVNDSPILSSQIEFFFFFFYILVLIIFDIS